MPPRDNYLAGSSRPHGVQGVEGSNPFTPTNKTSKGVRFHPPDALFHWGIGRIASAGIPGKGSVSVLRCSSHQRIRGHRVVGSRPRTSGRTTSILASASLTITRMRRSGWSAGTKSSSRLMMNKPSVNVSGPRIGGSFVNLQGQRTKFNNGGLSSEVFQQPARPRTKKRPECSIPNEKASIGGPIEASQRCIWRKRSPQNTTPGIRSRSPMAHTQHPSQPYSPS
jgi:hypothetical protein